MRKKISINEFLFISTFLLIILAIPGCKFEQRRVISGAKKFIKNEYIPLLHDHKSYELAKIEITDTIYLRDLENQIEGLSNLNNEGHEAIRKALERQKRISDEKYEKLYAGRSYYEEERKINRIDDLISKAREEIRMNDQIIKKYKEWGKLETSEGIVYISLYHQFRAKNQMGGVVLDEHEILYFPKNKSYSIK